MEKGVGMESGNREGEASGEEVRQRWLIGASRIFSWLEFKRQFPILHKNGDGVKVANLKLTPSNP